MHIVSEAALFNKTLCGDGNEMSISVPSTFNTCSVEEPKF